MNYRGWRHSGDKTLRIRVARLRRVGGKLLSNIVKETDADHSLSIRNHVDSQRLVITEHQRKFNFVASLTEGCEDQIQLMNQLFAEWSDFLRATINALDNLDTNVAADVSISQLKIELQNLVDQILAKLADIHQSLFFPHDDGVSSGVDLATKKLQSSPEENGSDKPFDTEDSGAHQTPIT